MIHISHEGATATERGPRISQYFQQLWRDAVPSLAAEQLVEKAEAYPAQPRPDPHLRQWIVW